MKVVKYPFVQVNNNEIYGNKVDIGGMSQISEISDISVDDYDFKVDFTETMESKASDTHNQNCIFHIETLLW